MVLMPPKLWTVLSASMALMMATVCSGKDGSVIDHTGCPVAFSEKCRCGRQYYAKWRPEQEVFVVNCTNTGFTDTSMLELLPNGTQVLLFNGNSIEFLDWNVFGVWDDHKYLEVIDLSNNNITEITGKAFHKVGSVKRLVLNHNNIKISGQHHHRRLLTNFYSLEELLLTNAFTEVVDSKWYLDDLKDILLASNMTKLYKLNLEQNEIWSISKNMFCDLPALSDVYLGDNQLTSIDFSFECIENLRFLDLQYNKIKRVDKNTLARIDSAFVSRDSTVKRRINLNMNPWVCDCYLGPFWDWVKSTATDIFRKDICDNHAEFCLASLGGFRYHWSDSNRFPFIEMSPKETVTPNCLADQEELRCYKGYPESNSGKLLSNARLDECPPNDLVHVSDGSSGGHPPHSPSTVTHALLTLLIVLVVCLILAVLYANRGRVRTSFKPLISNFRRSMQYRTIERSVNEANEMNTRAHGSMTVVTTVGSANGGPVSTVYSALPSGASRPESSSLPGEANV